jgi:hypothetical protein
MAWLKEIAWPFELAIFDGEACAGDGHEGIQAVFTERKRVDGDMALVLFDLLHLVLLAVGFTAPAPCPC